jgi:hypothetical protein
LPADVGVKFTLIVQLAAAAKLAPQVLVWLNRFALAPLMLIAIPVTGTVDVFFTVIVLAGLGEFVSCEKLSEFGVTV